MKKAIPKKLKLVAIFFLLCLWMGCEDFLDTSPYGTTTLQTLSSNSSGADGLLLAAYSNLDGVSSESFGFTAGGSNWIYGSILGGDAYKGSDPGDQVLIGMIEIHTMLNPLNFYVEAKWATYYQGIARSNDALKAFTSLSISDPTRDYTGRIAEARFLRGFYHFEIYKIFRHAPFIDEIVTDVRIGNLDDILPKIQEDFKYAASHLPPTQTQPGRITKGAAQAYFGISKMWEPNGYATAKVYFDSVINSGIYKLTEKFHDNFYAEFRNETTESILEVQQSVKDGSQGFNGNYGDILNYVYQGPGGCCGFHQPSQNLVNAFKTNASGLPLLDTYNDEDVTSDEGIESDDENFTPYQGTLDPRLDWTVGRRGIPYLDWGKHPGRDWIRDQVTYGPFSPKKYTLYKFQQEGYSDNSGWTAGLPTIHNFKLLRYADVLLYAAEAEVELNNLDKALEYVNLIRRRASKADGFVKDENGLDAANYFIKEYPSFPDVTFARKVVRFERRLELAMEGHRFFDLVRWGIAAEEKTKYFDKERIKRTYMVKAAFEKGTHELMPIPQRAIDQSYKNGEATLQQNHGY